MFTRFNVILVLIAFACLAFVAEGRLSDPEIFTESSPNDSTESSEMATASKFKSSFVNRKTTKQLELAAGKEPSSMCDHIHPDELPDECSCSEPGPFSLVIECLKTFNSTVLNDTIGMKIDLDPCNEEGAKLSLDVTEKEHGIDYTLVGISAGESKNIPIPGLAMIIPGIGNVGLDVAVLIAGNPDMLRLKIGLNACAQLSTDHQMCASEIPGVSSILPWYVLKGTYSFGDICAASKRERLSSNEKKETTNTNGMLLTE